MEERRSMVERGEDDGRTMGSRSNTRKARAVLMRDEGASSDGEDRTGQGEEDDGMRQWFEVAA